MEKHSFHFVDVFAEEKYAGNQLAVFTDAGKLASETMQRIAREINFSETTFVLSREQREGGYDVRIFTPQREVPFAGHPTLGTAYVIQQEIVGRPVEQVILNLQVGQIPVTFHYDSTGVGRLWMKQVAPSFGQVLTAAQIAPVLGLAEDEVDGRFPVEEVSTGIAFWIVPLKTLDSLKRIRVNREACFRLIEDREAKAILAFCPETYHPQNALCVRVFADYYGVAEDPATGSANGCLAGYLARHRYLGENRIDICVEQGYEIGRPSLLFLRAEDHEDRIDVWVGGKVIKVAEGVFL